jgi:hypothetical protein
MRIDPRAKVIIACYSANGQVRKTWPPAPPLCAKPYHLADLLNNSGSLDGRIDRLPPLYFLIDALLAL